MARPGKVLDEVVDLAVELLARRYHRSAIQKVLKEKFAIEAARTFGRVMRRARERMLAGTGKSSQTLMAEAIGFYEATIRGKDSDVRVKIRARERLDKLLGLDRVAKREAEKREGEELERSLPVIIEEPWRGKDEGVKV